MANERPFLLPDLGEGLTEGTIVAWLVAVGDTVEVDQPVAEMETAKAVVEVPSPFEGTVTQLHGEVGDEVEVGQPLVTVDVDGPGGAAPPAQEAEPADAQAQPGGTLGGSSEDAEVAEMVPSASDEVETGAAQDETGGESGSVLVGYGTGSSRARRRRTGKGTAAAAGPAGTGPSSGGPSGAPPASARPLAKPPVRKLAKDLGVDLAQVSGSGPDGVVTRADVEGFADDGQGAPAQVPPSEDYQQLLAEPGRPATATAEAPSPDLIERIPVRGIRKRIADKMTQSRREIPEATTWVDVDATELWELREELNASRGTASRPSDEEDVPVKVSPLAIVLRAVVAGLREFGEVNARLDTETNEIVLQRFVNLGFAAQTDRGLVVPVIKGADRMSTMGLAAELNRLAAAARDGSITPDEMQGGTFTVSNYGSFGVDGGSAVINHPEAAILGVGRITDRPWVLDGALTVRKVMQLSIAFDHRICDGGEAAGFLRYVADLCESRSALLGAL